MILMHHGPQGASRECWRSCGGEKILIGCPKSFTTVRTCAQLCQIRSWHIWQQQRWHKCATKPQALAAAQRISFYVFHLLFLLGLNPFWPGSLNSLCIVLGFQILVFDNGIAKARILLNFLSSSLIFFLSLCFLWDYS